MARTTVPTSVDFAASEPMAKAPLSLGGVLQYTGPFSVGKVLTLLYGLLTINGSFQFPRFNRQTIPDMWGRIYHNPFGVSLGIASEGITQGVRVGAGLTLLGCSVSVAGKVFAWGDLLSLEVHTNLTSIAASFGVSVAKPNSVIQGHKNEAQNAGFNEGYSMAQRSNVAVISDLSAQLVQAQTALKKKRARRR